MKKIELTGELAIESEQVKHATKLTFTGRRGTRGERYKGQRIDELIMQLALKYSKSKKPVKITVEF